MVLNLAVQDNAATAGRGAFLTFIYCLGLGIPFIITGLAFRHALGAFAVIKRHYGVVVWTGGLLLIAVGVLLLTGTWNTIANDLRGSVSGKLLNPDGSQYGVFWGRPNGARSMQGSFDLNGQVGDWTVPLRVPVPK